MSLKTVLKPFFSGTLVTGTLVTCLERREKPMERQKQIWLYGNSVILGTIGASLKRSKQFEVTTMVSPLPENSEKEPDVIFFDLEFSRPKDAFMLLESYPTLKLIGVSPDNNIVKVWSGKQLKELSTNDLLDMVNEQVKDSFKGAIFEESI